jgi:hypothetical protein
MEIMMAQHDFILLILNCQKYRWKAEHQKNTWLKSLPENLLYFHVIGDPLLSSPLFDMESHILYVNTDDDYNSLPKKVIAAFEAIHNTFDFKYIFKTDDDQTLLQEGFFKTMMGLLTLGTPKYHYGGYIVDVKKPHISTYYTIHNELPRNLVIEAIKYCNGRFYFLSNNSVVDLLKKKEEFSKQYLEDYSVGFFLDPVLKREILNINSGRVFQDTPPPP